MVVGNATSALADLLADVPQGSVLGPLLFLVYINDNTKEVKSNIRLFADETTLFLNADSKDAVAETLNDDLANVEKWAKQWLVTFSPSKTNINFQS